MKDAFVLYFVCVRACVRVGCVRVWVFSCWPASVHAGAQINAELTAFLNAELEAASAGASAPLLGRAVSAVCSHHPMHHACHGTVHEVVGHGTAAIVSEPNAEFLSVALASHPPACAPAHVRPPANPGQAPPRASPCVASSFSASTRTFALPASSWYVGVLRLVAAAHGDNSIPIQP